jgi:hypothetical protein
MIDTSIIDLMHKEIDGEITPEEKSTLEIYLAENPDANKRYHDLLAVDKNLQKLEDVDPPTDLKSNILSNIDPELYSQDKQNKGTIINFNTWFTQRNIRNILAYAAVFIVGICISPLFLFPPTADNYQDLKDIYGTIGIDGYENLSIDHSQKVNLYGISGSIDMRESTNIVWLESNLQADKSFTIQILYRPQELVFSLFKPLDPEKISFEHSENKLTITTAKPFILSFTKNSKTASLLKIALNPSGSNKLEYKFLTK